jgi:hypothetical protein
MNLDGVETDLLLDTYHPVPSRFRSAGKPAKHVETDAHRLRAKGLSYRRIAQELRVRYDLVSRWLSGPPPDAAFPEPIPRCVVLPPPEIVAARPDRIPDAQDLPRRIDGLMATLRQVSRENQEREARLHRLIEEQQQSMREREIRHDAEIAALRATVDALAIRLGPADRDEEAQPLRPGFWRRRSVR